MKRFAKIICTLGPASNDEAMIIKMAERGMDVARINFSHGDRAAHQKMIDQVRSANKKKGFQIKILQDLEGYRLRIGKFRKKKLLERGQVWYMSQEHSDLADYIPFDYEEDIKTIEKGSQMFIDDGKIHMRVAGYSGKRLKLRVVQGGVLTERKGINIPRLKLKANIMTEKDKLDLEFGLENGVEIVAQSFVRNRKDIQKIVEIVKPKLPDCKVLAKIECEEGVRNIESILDACDGVLVARGDLGVTLPIYKIPLIQKYIISLCSRKKKLSATATQMLDSMIDQGRPTRAEVSDVANAVLDGSDYVTLSGETAIGKYPSRCIKMMSQIVEYTEKVKYFRP